MYKLSTEMMTSPDRNYHERSYKITAQVLFALMVYQPL